MAKDSRARVWTIVVYPESAPENWKSILNDEHIKWICSPLHDLDVNPDGEVKKAHWHVILAFETMKSYSQIKELADKINAPIPQKVANIRGAVRYLVHLDNPEKYQYSTSQIEAYGGADIAEYFKATVTEKREILKEMVAYIRDNNVTEFIDFSLWCAENNDEWWAILTESSSYFIGQVIKSQRHKG